MATITKLPSGSYRIRERVNGVYYSKTVKFKPKQSEARRIIYDMVETGETIVERMTMQTAIERYIDARAQVLSPSTIAHYKSYIKQLPIWFLNHQLSTLTDDHAQRLVNELTPGHSAKTVLNIYGLVRATVGYFRPRLQLCAKTPMRIDKEQYTPIDSDVQALFEAAKGTKYEAALKLAAFGLRRSEICALTVDDVGTDTVRINKAKVKNDRKQYIVKDTTKTAASTRVIRITPELSDLIHKQGYVYKGSPHSIYCYMDRTLKRLGLPHFALHRLRHYYASASHAMGIPDAYIMASGGWETDRVMKSVYRHAQANKMEQFAARVVDHMNGISK